MCAQYPDGGGAALVVDDDPSLLGFLVEALPEDRLRVYPAADAGAALEVLRGARPDVAVVDMGLPGMSGIELIEHLRAGEAGLPWDPGMPVIAMSGRGDPHTPVRALTRGADDFVAKPIHYPELVARIGAVLRRCGSRPLAADLLAGGVRVNLTSRAVAVRGEPLRLSNKEFALLVTLMRHPGRVFPKSDLLRDVWGYGGAGARTRTVESHASRLRCKLAEAGAPDRVENVWGVGYRFRADG